MCFKINSPINVLHSSSIHKFTHLKPCIKLLSHFTLTQIIQESLLSELGLTIVSLGPTASLNILAERSSSNPVHFFK